MIAYLSNLMIPMVIFGIVILALSTKIDMFAAFTKGAKDGFKVAMWILLTLHRINSFPVSFQNFKITSMWWEICTNLSVHKFPSQLVHVPHLH